VSAVIASDRQRVYAGSPKVDDIDRQPQVSARQLPNRAAHYLPIGFLVAGAALTMGWTAYLVSLSIKLLSWTAGFVL
jgi:hypothetical protein